jgi:hypothetical protein
MYHMAVLGMSTHDPHSVLEELKRQARRKASLRMFYAVADFLRDYHGLRAQETAVERESGSLSNTTICVLQNKHERKRERSV